jgi:lysophospholipase L1-like esterase
VARRFGLATLGALAGLLFGVGPISASPSQSRWVGSWASAQMLVDPKDALPVNARKDTTLRQLIRTTIGGTSLRLRLSNAFGKTPLTINGVHVARAVSRSSSHIDPATDRNVTFGGAPAITIPAGAEYVSDPVVMPVPPLTTLAVTMHFDELPALQTGHPGSRATSYLANGDRLAASDLNGAQTIDHWYFVAGLDVQPSRPAAAIAVLGDSITDGHGVVSNSDTRWTDTLAERLRASAATRPLAVLNLGIGGNRMIEDGLGPNAVARFDRDVLVRDGVKYLIILEGVNDLGVLTRDAPASPEAHRALVEHMLSAYAQIIAQAHHRGIEVIAGTVMPYGASGYYHPAAVNEADRMAIDSWLRAPGQADAVIDFDVIMRDPEHPERLRKDLDSGDGLHPSAAGYRLMGYSFSLSLFTDKDHR